jgi:hypothetical protein
VCVCERERERESFAALRLLMNDRSEYNFCHQRLYFVFLVICDLSMNKL